ncbi:MAG TPA: sugar phosphorylase [Chloroflexi bacterium]|nr:sugar phosphorylase [Chloroflexota bacterium]
MMPSDPIQQIHEHLDVLYGPQIAKEYSKRILDIFDRYPEIQIHEKSATGSYELTQKDILLIAYGDIVQEPNQPTLRTLDKFLTNNLDGLINAVHILPFYPYSSDDGFSVIDYRQVDPNLGSWEDVRNLAASKRIMFDAVINHISQESEWFKRFLASDPDYRDYFIVPEPDWDFSDLVRPRTSPVLTEFHTNTGKKRVWTTFSADQIDLNFSNPEVLVEILDLLVFYVSQGASLIRLDAIAYLWKESGSPCIHLEQTHRVVKLMRLILDMTGKDVVVITETNVPHEENISYFGKVDPLTGRTDEAHMVYQFPLAPLVLHTLMTGSAGPISKWVDSLHESGIFFNFIASHDGIGVMPAKGLLSEQEVDAIVDQVLAHGGQVSHKSNPDGSQVVYELNTTLFDALNDPENPNKNLNIPRFLASQVILLCLAGVPGIYYHSLFGSRNSLTNLQRTGRARSINREKFDLSELENTLDNPGLHQVQVFSQYKHLLSMRINQAAFHPQGQQKVFFLEDRVFSLLRTSPDGSSRILTLVNISSDTLKLTIDTQEFGLTARGKLEDLISDSTFEVKNGQLELSLEPYQALWIKNTDK